MKVIENTKTLLFKNKFIILAFLIFFIPRIISLGSDISNYDASYWYPRMDSFTDNLLELDFKGTYQKYHPGVTLLWLSGTSKYLFQEAFEMVFHYNPRFIPQQFIKLNAASIFPLVLAISILGAICYHILSKITSRNFALVFSIILSLEPFFLGVSKFLHLSGLGGMLSYASFLLCYYYYFQKERKEYLFYVSAVLAGLGLLTKIDSALAIAFNFLVIVYFEIIQSKNLTESLKSIFIKGILYGVISFLTFYALFPSMWVAPVWTMNKIIQEGIFDTAFESSGEDTLSDIAKLFYPEFIFIRNMPSTVILMVIGFIISFVDAKRKKLNNITKFVLIGGTIYSLFNIVLLTIPGKSKDRYITNFYPGLIILSTYGFYYLYQNLKQVRKVLIITLIIAYTITLYRYYPVYSYYFTDLLGGPGGLENTGRIKLKNRGEYYAQAAQFINKSDSNAVEKNVVTDSREQIRTFQPFFYGTTYTNPKFMPDGAYADYIVTRQENEHLIPQNLCNKIASFGPRSPMRYETIKVYKCEGIDNTYKDFRN